MYLRISGESFKKLPHKLRKNFRKIIAGGITAIYEGVLAKYLYDLYGVFSNPVVAAATIRGRLPISPVEASLFPWPSFYDPLSQFPSPPSPLLPRLTLTRPMTPMEHAVKYFYDNPLLQAVAVGLPLISYGIYWGIKKYRESHKNDDIRRKTS